MGIKNRPGQNRQDSPTLGSDICPHSKEAGLGFSTTVARAPGPGRRELAAACSAAAAAVGLPAWAGEKMAERIAAGERPAVVWLRLCECAGCGESLLGGDADRLTLLSEVAALDGGDPPAGAAGHALEAAIERGDFVLVIEGARRRPDGAFECPVADASAGERARRLAAAAAAVVAVGSCAPPPPAAGRFVLDRAGVVALPGCPADPRRLLGIVLQLATFGTLPALDAEGRPHLAYGHVVHEDCPRRPRFDAGQFARAYGDAGHHAGFCLYELGCGGPRTAARCALLPVCEAPGGWSLGTGHPCVGCAEQGIALEPSLFDAARPGARSTASQETSSPGSRG
jgi:hydrogenase small subunit